MAKRQMILRPACVEYFDLCEYEKTSREDFLSNCGLKIMRVFGLTLEIDNLVRVMFYDDESDNDCCSGIVIPDTCIKNITYFTEDLSELPILQDEESGVN